MKLFLICAALLAVVSAKSFSPKKLKDLEYGFCEGANEVLEFTTLNVSPYPLQIHSGKDLTLEVMLNLLEQVPEGAKLSLNLKKKGIIDLPIPCLEINDIHIGSCDYDAQEILDFGAEFLCPDYFPEGQTCTLPLNPGMYGGEPLTVTFGDLPDLIVDLLASGTYEAKVHAYLADGTEMTCIYLRAELE